MTRSGRGQRRNRDDPASTAGRRYPQACRRFLRLKAPYGCSEATYAAAVNKSSEPRLATTGTMSGVQVPARLPCCMS